MKRTAGKILCAMCVLMMTCALVLCMPVTLNAATYSGDCGDEGSSVTWSMNTTAKTLTFSGTGDIAKYTYSQKAPWYTYRSSIERVVIGEGVTGIGSYAFYDVSSIASVTLPTTLKSIGGYSFRGCSSLTALDIPSGVETIEYDSFAGCSSLTSLQIPDSVTSIGSYAFSGCKSLTSVTLPSGLTSIESNTFSGCTALTDIVIPHGVETIGASAFSGCTVLANVTIPASVTSIGNSAFFSFRLENVYVTDIYAWMNITFGDTYSNPMWEAENFYLCGIKPTEITIPAGTVRIKDYVFYNLDALTRVTIPSGVTSIGNSAFSGCSALSDITLPSTVTSIGKSAFYGCESLTEINIPSSITSISNSAFNTCSSLEAVTIPSGVTSIGDLAFLGCSSLESITIPSRVRTLGARAFEACSGIKTITVPSGVSAIGERTFYGCTSLRTVNLHTNVKSIGESAFENCTALLSVGKMTGVTSIGKSAFNNCRAMKSFTVPAGVTVIEEYTFTWCKSLEKIVINSNITEIGHGAFSYCQNLMEVHFAEGALSIGDYAFNSCTRLRSITLPKSLVTVSETAFEDTSLWHVIYRGSQTEWMLASDQWPVTLTYAARHYGAGSGTVTSSVTRSTACITEGAVSFSCTLCAKTTTVSLPVLGHEFSEGECTRCSVLEADLIESDHPYPNSSDLSYTITKEGAVRIAIVFSSNTYVLLNKDYIYIYDAEDNLIGRYTGTALASKRLVVHSDKVRIRLVSDASGRYYGFSLTDVRAYYEECLHGDVIYENAVPATCTDAGYSGDGYCEECQVNITGSVTAPLGHSFGRWMTVVRPTDINDGLESRYCSRCPAAEHNTIAKFIINGTAGDLDNDGVYSNTDITFVVRHLSGQSIYDDGGYASLADMNGDGHVNNRDAITIIVMVANDEQNSRFEGYTAVSSQAELESIALDLSGKYYLTADIILEGEWAPIGSYSAPFTGVLDGNGCKITGLSINSEVTAATYAGLIGYNKGTLSDLDVIGSITVTNNSTKGSIYAGGIAGYNLGKILNCTSEVSVTASAVNSAAFVYAGGIAAYTGDASEITGCVNSTAIDASCPNSSYAGGITGYAKNATVTDCGNEAGVGSVNYGGGIAGQIAGSVVSASANSGSVRAKCCGGIAGCSTSSSTVTKCVNTAYISGMTYTGGIVGRNYANIENCYNTADIASDTYYVGGIAGLSESASSLSNCFSTGEAMVAATGSAYAGGIAGANLGSTTCCYYLDVMLAGVGKGTDGAVKLTSAQFGSRSSFAGFDFENVWTMGDNLPVLK